MLKKFDLTGRTGLVTGACGLLGIEHSKALLECGATVILTDVNNLRLQEVRQGLMSKFEPSRILTHFMDVTDLASICAVSNWLELQGLRVDVLINNAAIDPKVSGTNSLLENSRLERFDRAQWDAELAVGLTGAFLCSQIFGTKMAVDGKGGVIINIASDLSVFAPDQRLYRKDGLPEELQPVKPVTYSVIKAGLVGLTRYLATYWADKGVRTNALSPGGVFNGQREEFVQRLTSLIPMGRMAAMDEYHSAIQFLASDASAYMNGQNLVIDGGRSVW